MANFLFFQKRVIIISFTVFAERRVKVDAVVSVKCADIYIYIYRLALYIVRLPPYRNPNIFPGRKLEIYQNIDIVINLF